MAEKKTKVKFTAQDEETLIDFVKSNEILYNAHHKNYRDTEAKNRLWLKLAQSINKDGMYFFKVIREFHFDIRIIIEF